MDTHILELLYRQDFLGHLAFQKSRLIILYSVICYRNIDDEEDQLLESGQNDVDTERKGKFLLYWLTTTSTSTTTSFTSTTSIAGVECTPAGFTMSSCAGK